MNIMYIGSNDYNYVYWKHSLQANMHNRIFGTFTRIRTSNMRIFTFSIFVPTYIPTSNLYDVVERNTPELLQCDDDSMIVTDSYDATLFTESIF